MKNLPSTLSRLTLALASALALGACNRSEYAMLPRSASYLGSTPVARTRPAEAPAATSAPVAPATPLAPVIAEGKVAEPVAPAPSVAASKVAAPGPATAPPVPTTAAAPATVAARPAPATPAAAPKLNLVQRLALSKVMRKLDKQAQRMTTRRGDNTASTARGGIDGKLRYAIIFGAISLIFFVIGGSVGNLIGTILLVIGLLFLLFWLLDAL